MLYGANQVECRCQHVEQAIEADSGPEQWSKIVSSHNHILLEATWIWGTSLIDDALAEPFWPRRQRGNLGKIPLQEGGANFFALLHARL
jgi:hypothetical protein